MSFLESAKQYTGSDLETIFFRPILSGDSARELGVRVLYNMPVPTTIQLWDGQRNVLQKYSAAGWTGGNAATKLQKTISLGRVKAELGFSAADYFSLVYEKIAAVLKRRKIGAFFYIGGNDSMDTVQKLSAYFKEISLDVKVIGIPKTIDNDLCITDHTPGFGSAAKYVATTMQEIIRDSSVYSIPSVTIVEIMGRHAGWLTASSAVLHAYGEPAPHLVYVPETHFSAERFLHDVEQEMAKHKAVIVAVSEGVSVPEGVQSGLVDNFGHKYLSGIGKYLEQLVRDTFGCKVRSVELNVMQRCSSHLSSKTDIDEAEQIGAAGVQCALRGETGRVMIFRRIHNKPYTVVMEPADASQIANREKFLPREFLTPAGNNISDEAMSYFLPLIQGELNLMMRGGIPMHFTIQESVLK